MAPEEHFDELGKQLEQRAAEGDEDARATLERLEKYRSDPDDDALDWLNEAAIRWESEHPELANIAVRVINALTAGGF